MLAAAFAAQAADIKIVVVSHGQASDPFWSVVKNGVAEAAKDTGVQVEYRAPETFDMVQMAQLIDAAINQKPQGLVVSIPDADALGPSIERAVAAGIPVLMPRRSLARFCMSGRMSSMPERWPVRR
ncbi:d-ribose-binding periplasmic protein precursor [Brucella melitensis bv. 1 str. 16M]|uniref:D-ribose-binding periplasmic protein n=1 Tax=Brucella melitensis biotype 1 (strain ATCC 23456 / CCUG 17765 / NCTC 10094 / 16M) TaxID=224914 RepID=Q8YHY3_BRUME|nr:d-ribose-binding periplasmic protein precursor [Brucella melitensis bv. 1 str. 16M]